MASNNFSKRSGPDGNNRNPIKIRQGQEGTRRNYYLPAPNGNSSNSKWQCQTSSASATSPHPQPAGVISYCTTTLTDCKDPGCLKRHPPSTLENSYRNDQRLRREMKDNMSNGLLLIDREIWHTRKAYINEQAASDDGDCKKERLGAKIFELIAQRHAFCERVYETLHLRLPIGQIVKTLWRDLYRLNNRLPALAKRLDLEAAIRNSDVVIVVGATGSGKSTQIPQYLHDMPEFNDRTVYCTQPRRIATVSLAERVALEYAGGYRPGAKVGKTVGFQIGGLSKRSRSTMIEYMTEGMLIQNLAERFSHLNDDENNNTAADNNNHGITLKRCAAVVVDEVHERGHLVDFLLGLLKEKQKLLPGLKVIVSSATIDKDRFSRYFGGCPIVEIPGKSYPVEIKYVETSFLNNARLVVDLVLTKTIELITTTSEGHILCFLTGQAEVERALERLNTTLSHNYPDKARSTIVQVLFGKQTPDEQQKVVRPAKNGFRKVVFATDVAETSLTVDAVKYVVDCGYAKEAVYDSQRNVTTLKVFPISKSSADQRAGRAGRTAPGFCYRLYSKRMYDKMDLYPKPEIQCRSLALTVTTLIVIGKDPFTFDWIDAPDRTAIETAVKELRLLSIIEEGPIESARVTDLGRAISCLQIEPSLGRMIYYACRQGYGKAATIIAGLMTSGFNFFPNCKNSFMRSKYISEKGDVVSAYRSFCDWLILKQEDEKEHKQQQNGDKEEEKEETTKNDANVEYVVDEREMAADSDVIEGDNFEQEIEMTLPDEVVEFDLDLDEELAEDTLPTSPRIQEWATANHVSSDACYMSHLEMTSLTCRLQTRGFWKMSAKQDLEPSDEDIQKMVLNALAMNVAKINGSSWSYHVLTTDTDGEVTDKSSLRQMPGIKPPAWIVYHEGTLASNGRTYLNRVTPIDPDLIRNGTITVSADFRRLLQ